MLFPLKVDASKAGSARRSRLSRRLSDSAGRCGLCLRSRSVVGKVSLGDSVAFAPCIVRTNLACKLQGNCLLSLFFKESKNLARTYV